MTRDTPANPHTSCHDAPQPFDAVLREYIAVGLSALPAAAKRKRPTVAWREFTRRLPSADELDNMTSGDAVCVVAGAVSGNLEVLDFDQQGARFDAWAALVPVELLTRLTLERTPSGGYHAAYLCETAVSGNAKLATTATGEVLIETRGEGGLCLVSPSPGYLLVQHDFLALPVLTTGERETLLVAARSLDERPARRPSEDHPPRNGHHAAADPRVIERARRYVAKLPPAISGQGGHNATFKAAAELFWGFGLDDRDGLDLLAEYNLRCQPPWSDTELGHKWKSAKTSAAANPSGRPRGWRLEPRNSRPSGRGGAAGNGKPPLVLHPQRTLPTAERYLADHHHHADGQTLRWYAGDPWTWDGSCWRLMEVGAIKRQMLRWLSGAVVVTASGEVAPYPANARTMNGAVESLAAVAHLSADTASPSWIGKPPASLAEVKPRDLLACRTKLLHLPTGRTYPSTPALWNQSALDFDHEPSGPEPKNWFDFLAALWPNDEQSVELLQEWMGILLTLDTSQQKILLIEGPPRGGKSNLARVMTKLVGERNVVSPTVASLAGNFGLQQLIGKSVAIIGDARFTGRDVSEVVDHLKGITGEDPQTIQRKFREPITLRLPVRFTILANELPRASEVSGAFSSRFLLLRLTKSHLGAEDLGLSNRLLGELPGILRWALEGLARLRERGRFVQPESSSDALQELADLTSPVGAFVRECCLVGPEQRVWADDLFRAWICYCEADGCEKHGTRNDFGRNLRAVLPAVVRREGSNDGRRARFYEGVALR